jgi:hypothetical protein
MIPDERAAATSRGPGAAWISSAAVLAILLAGLVLRLVDFRGPFDREFEGAQGAFFALGAVNYERLGLDAAGGYPVVNVDLDAGALGAVRSDLRSAPGAWYVYANHPPLVPWISWASIRAGQGPGWAAACDQGRAPAGVEPWIRAPFLLFHLAALGGLWWALKAGAGARRAWVALAIAASMPVAVLYGSLVNYENPSLLCAVLAAGFSARWIATGSPRLLWGACLCFGLGSLVSFATACFAPPLALLVLLRAGMGRAARFTLAVGLSAGLPLLLHGFWSARVLAELGHPAESVLVRARALWAPLLDGTAPPQHWAALQIERLGPWFGWPAAAAAAMGLAVLVARGLAAKKKPLSAAAGVAQDREPPGLEPALLAGGCLYLFVFYRHTLDPQHPFLLMLVPGLAGLAALGLERLVAPFGRPALPLATLGLAATLALQGQELRREFRAPRSTANPTQAIDLPDVTGAEFAGLVPAGGFGIHPACVGLNAAVTFYAWRSLWPAASPADTLPRAVARAFGLGSAPHVLLLPKHPWPGVAAEILNFEREWVGSAPADRESAHWRAWDLH